MPDAFGAERRPALTIFMLRIAVSTSEVAPQRVGEIGIGLAQLADRRMRNVPELTARHGADAVVGFFQHIAVEVGYIARKLEHQNLPAAALGIL